MQPTQELAVTLPSAGKPEVFQHGVFDNAELFNHALNVAKVLCKSTMVPKSYQGEVNHGNTVIAVDIAWRLQLPPLMVMQHLYVVYGTPAWSGQMVIALINNSGMFKEPLEYETRSEKGKDDWGCRCKAMLKDTGTVREGPWITIAMAKAEGWYGKQGSKWQTMPEMMLRYRAAAYFGRTICPHVTIGLRLVEEEEEIPRGPTIDVPMFEEPAAAMVEKPAEPPQDPDWNVRRRKVKKQEPVAPKTEAVPEPTTEVPSDPAQLIGIGLMEAGVTVDSFFDWLNASGKGQTYRFDVTSCGGVDELPLQLLKDLLGKDRAEFEKCLKMHGAHVGD